jgi:hypothetical protein
VTTSFAQGGQHGSSVGGLITAVLVLFVVCVFVGWLWWNGSDSDSGGNGD